MANAGEHGPEVPPDSRYYGPFGPSQPGPDGYTPGPDYTTWAPVAAPAPLLVTPLVPSAARSRRRPPRTAAVVALAAATALVVGGGAGYGGARLAERGGPPVATAAPVPAPSVTDPDPIPSSSASATPLPAPPPVANTVEIAKRVLPSTVMIQVGNGTGSGFVLDTQGRIMTNNHVVADAADGAKIRVVFANGRRVRATLLGRSPSYDLAVIKVKAAKTLKPIAIGDSAAAQVGEAVVAVGSPLGLPGTVTQGIVSARHRPVVVSENAAADAPSAYIDAIQTDAPINPGNSGGPLVDAAARIIGVNSAILTLGSNQDQAGSIGIGFAIPINQAVTIGNLLISKGKATYPVIGASVQDGSGGVEITAVESGGPAGRAGLRVGDTITEIDGARVRAMEELVVRIRTRRPGQQVKLGYTRGSAAKSVGVTLGGKEG